MVPCFAYSLLCLEKKWLHWDILVYLDIALIGDSALQLIEHKNNCKIEPIMILIAKVSKTVCEGLKRQNSVIDAPLPM